MLVPCATISGARTAALILLAEDDDDTREMLAVFLANSGFEVEQATNGADALAMAGRRVPDVIISDIAMPVRDGIWLGREIKRDERTACVPLIALTCNSSMAVAERALAVGFEVVLPKPCRLDELLVSIRSTIARSTALAADDAAGRPETVGHAAT